MVSPEPGSLLSRIWTNMSVLTDLAWYSLLSLRLRASRSNYTDHSVSEEKENMPQVRLTSA
jgi:hypothetical protein